MTSDNVTLPVYEEVDIPPGTPVSEVLTTLDVDYLYTDNPDAAPEEPIETITSQNDHYQESYNGNNTARVFLVTFVMKRLKT